MSNFVLSKPKRPPRSASVISDSGSMISCTRSASASSNWRASCCGLKNFALVLGGRPPALAAAKPNHRLGEQLLAHQGQAGDVDRRAFDRPEPAPAGLVLDIHVLIGGADEQALPLLGDIVPAERRPIVFLRAG